MTPLVLDDRQMQRLQRLYADYKRMHEDPQHCLPKIIVSAPTPRPTWEEQLADPRIMLAAELEQLRPHLEVEDDRVPTVRVQFGTAQVAAAFGCELAQPTDSLPAAATHVLSDPQAAKTLAVPALEAGIYRKLAEFTDYFRAHLPAGVHIQHPDIQSPFNSAHLIRGNDILLDFYDDPEAVEALLDRVADFMIALVPRLRQQIGAEDGWFFDWGAMWKGSARLSNCSMHMIGPELYVNHVMARDVRVLESIGGGRIHYCGTFPEVIDEFFKLKLLSGFDYETKYHDLWALAERAPEKLVLFQAYGEQAPEIGRLLDGEWPAKRNVVVHVDCASWELAREKLSALRKSALKRFS